MRNPGGYLFSFDCAGTNQECDTFTCFHCNKVVVVKAMCDPADLGGMCRLCGKLICPSCVDLGKCDPFEKKILRQELAYEALRSYGQ